MRKTAPAAWLTLLLALSFSAGALVTVHTHAQSILDLNQTVSVLKSKNKASSELIRKTETGQGTDRVRVIIQPSGAWNDDLNYATLLNGATNIRQFQNFNF